ncbi:MAG: pyruvate oxidase [Acidobacteria bacterium]|nr:pyruvate oxidase [Acidobacteriota bacterium]
MKIYTKLLQVLEAHQVRHIFGVPGDAINPLIEAIRELDAIRYIHVSHEEAGAFAASAAAKLTGRPQVCAGTVGPGAIHLLNGLYDAKKDRAPVLAIVGQVAGEYIGSSYHQEVDLHRLFSDVADYLVQINDPAQAPQAFTEACNAAVANGGVSVVIVPHDVGSGAVADFPVTAFEASEAGRLTASPEVLRKAGQALDRAERICLLVGEGCRSARELLAPLARHLAAPIVLTLKAKDLLPCESEFVAGGLGLLGSKAGVAAMEGCDLLLMLGTDFPYKEWLNDDCEAVQVDTRAATLGKRRPGALAVHADVAMVAPWLLEHVKAKQDSSLLEAMRSSKASWNERMDRLEDLGRSSDVIHPQGLARLVGDLARDDAIFTCDTGEVTVWCARHLRLRPGQRFSLSFNLASMAYAMPAALGAQLAFPGRQVISLSGDGGFNMLMGDFLTAVKYELAITVVVFNNGKLGLIKMEQAAEGYPESETDLRNPDYAALADAMGGKGFRVNGPSELRQKLTWALETDGPTLLDVPVSPDEITWPPKIQPSQALGFGLAKLRELVGV